MANPDTIKLLQECDAGTKMGVSSIDEILEKVQDEKLKKLLASINARKQKVKDLVAAGKLDEATTEKALMAKEQKEFDLLSCLLSTPGKVYSREELMEKVWNYDYYGDMRTVDVTVRRLREKIEDDPGAPKIIKTKRGAGYYSGE